MLEDVVAHAVLPEAHGGRVEGDLLAPEGDYWDRLGDALDGDGAVLMDNEGASIRPKVVCVEGDDDVVVLHGGSLSLSSFLLLWLWLWLWLCSTKNYVFFV